MLRKIAIISVSCIIILTIFILIVQYTHYNPVPIWLETLTEPLRNWAIEWLDKLAQLWYTPSTSEI